MLDRPLKSRLVPILAIAGLLLILTLAYVLPERSGAPAYVQRVALQEAKQGSDLTASIRGEAGAPLVVIDAGHGGTDPGAVAVNGLAEKDVVLGLAEALRDRLLAQGGVRVAMTRDDDRFIDRKSVV